MYSVFFLVPFLFYNLLCFFSVISLLFSKGCWLCFLCMCELNSLCTDLAPWALCVCVMYAACVVRSLTCARRSFAGWEICLWQGAEEEDNSAGSWLSSFKPGSPSWWLWSHSPLSWKCQSLHPQASPTTGADVIIGLCQGCVLGYVRGPGAQQMYSTVSCKII